MIRKALIMGAAGRDFHNFNTFFRDNPDYKVVAFTAAQISELDTTAGVEKRVYPPELAGQMYPKGIRIYPESMLEQLKEEVAASIAVGNPQETHTQQLEEWSQDQATALLDALE